MTTQAQAIEKRHTKECEICKLLDVDNKTMTWHCFKTGYMLNGEDDKHICNDCLEGLKDIRKKCNQKFDNPKHELFKDFVPWFYQNHPGMVEAFRLNVTATPPVVV